MSKNASINISSTQTNPDSWFAQWFDTPYYHILYKDRDQTEAQLFMDNLTNYLNLPENAKILDLACGKGRHSVYLNQLGYDVTGVDLSQNSITQANLQSNPTLQFKVHDMRNKHTQKYDAVFNLFTSFGYFENPTDNLNTLIAIQDSLSEYGFGVIDFMNADYVIKNLVPEETKTIDGITFTIKRYTQNNWIYKEISFKDQGQNFHFTEKVQALTLQDFEKMMDQASIYLLDIFGNYKLQKFYSANSERLILIFK